MNGIKIPVKNIGKMDEKELRERKIQFSEKFVFECKRLKIKKEDLANLADLKTIYKWRNGEALPKIEVALQLCELFDCELDYLFTPQKTRRKAQTDIMEATGLQFEAADFLRWMSRDEQVRQRLFLNDLLSDTEALYFISTRYLDYRYLSGLSRAKLHESGVAWDDAPNGQYLKEEHDRERERSLFSLQQSIVRFAEKERGGNGVK